MKILLTISLVLSQLAFSQTNRDIEWRAVHKRASKSSSTDLPKSLELIDSLLRTGFQGIHDSTKAYNYKLHGVYSARLGDLDRGMNDLEEAFLIFSRLGDQLNASDSRFNMANIKLYRGEMDDAVSYYLRSIHECESCNDSSVISTGYSHSANILYLMGDIDEAETYLNKAMDMATESDNISVIKSLQAGIARDKGDLILAQRLFTEVINSLDKETDPLRYAIGALGLSGVMEDKSERLAMMAEVEQIISEQPEDFGQMLASSEFFDHYYELGDTAKAMEWYQKGLIFAQKSQNRLEEGLLQYHMGLQLIKEKQFKQALALLEDASLDLIDVGAYGEAEACIKTTIEVHTALGDDVSVKRSLNVLELFQSEREDARKNRFKPDVSGKLNKDQLQKQSTSEETIQPFYIIAIVTVILLIIGWFMVGSKNK